MSLLVLVQQAGKQSCKTRFRTASLGLKLPSPSRPSYTMQAKVSLKWGCWFVEVLIYTHNIPPLPFPSPPPPHPQPATFHNSAEQLQLYYLSSRKFPTIFQQQEDHLFLHTFDRPLDEGEAGGRGRGGKNHRSKLTFRKPANWTTYISTRYMGGCRLLGII